MIEELGETVEIEIRDYMSFLGKDYDQKVLAIQSLESFDKTRQKKVTVFEHESKGKIYRRPRIILDRNFQDLLGKYYMAFKSKATYRHTVMGKETEKKEGLCIVLFFSEKKQEEKTASP